MNLTTKEELEQRLLSRDEVLKRDLKQRLDIALDNVEEAIDAYVRVYPNSDWIEHLRWAEAKIKAAIIGAKIDNEKNWGGTERV